MHRVLRLVDVGLMREASVEASYGKVAGIEVTCPRACPARREDGRPYVTRVG